MEEEIKSASTTNGGATNAEKLEMKVSAAPSANPNVWEGNNAAPEVSTDPGNVVSREQESNTAEHHKPQSLNNMLEEEDLGQAEYLENETTGYECEDERELTKEAATVLKKNIQKEKENKEKLEVAPAETKDHLEEDAHSIEQDEEDTAADEDAQEEEVVEDEGELITGDDAREQLELTGDKSVDANIRARYAVRNQEEKVDENQCRVCTTKEQLSSLFTKTIDGSTPADMLLLLCPSVSIALKDFMPQFICSSCLENLTVAIHLRKQLENTERDLRKRLSRSKNKVRRPRGYVVIDAPVTDSDTEEDEEELNDDVEFKVSDVADSTSPDSDSADTDVSEKRRPGRRRRQKQGMKRATGSNEEDHPRKKSYVSPSASGAAYTGTQGPFECDQCDLSFQRKQSYVMHRKMHDSRQEYHCQICNKKFKVRGAYKTHMERHASERAQFRCELCAQVFRLRAELKRHMAISHDEHGIIYECKRCQRTFLTQTRLQRHQSTNCSRHTEQKAKRQANDGQPSQGRDLFKSVAPLTTTYWSDSFSD